MIITTVFLEQKMPELHYKLMSLTKKLKTKEEKKNLVAPQWLMPTNV